MQRHDKLKSYEEEINAKSIIWEKDRKNLNAEIEKLSAELVTKDTYIKELEKQRHVSIV